MLVSTAFNIGELSPYVEVCFEDPSDMRSNPLEEREVDAESAQEGPQDPNEGKGTNQDQGNQGNQISLQQIQALFSYTKPELITVLEGRILGVSKTSYGHVLLCWTP